MDKRERIIQAAIDVFSDKGIEKATISEIVKKAGIAQGTFYLYFNSKLAVMPDIAELMVRKILEGLTSEVKDGPIDQQIGDIIHVIFKITNEYKVLTKLIYTGLTQTQYVGSWEEIYAPLYNWVENLLQRGKEAQAINSDVNTKFTAKIIIGSVESVAEQVYLYDHLDEDSIIRYKNELHKFVANAIGAYR
ncbi:TetR family transcriptional regulator [Sporosarcina highlanderae]|uniref:TetR family transcriptional regulator n=1 Tax=Sporosarcina highlanderae TaxID=3035916 RepID=A0ABT8JN69_9BACL|nr:TetR family transcriptional regulator [Sporosarcina highlanderae]MDN4606492.1 TetR family transcriptional regulator [Sporosarcina highlanderae]